MARWFLGLCAIVLAAEACDPCAGVPSCRTEPELSYSGQFIEFPSGRQVSGVSIAFARSDGAALVSDTIRAVSDADGFFVLRGAALEAGIVSGSFLIEPPQPHAPYAVRGIRLESHSKRGDGGFLGRLMVNPFLQFIGELHDIDDQSPVSGASVTVRQLGEPAVEPPSAQFVTGNNGRFEWTPRILNFEDLAVEFEISVPGHSRSYFVRDTIALQYRDELPRVEVVLVGSGRYVAEVIRRGTKQYLSGVMVAFTRTGGIPSIPEQFEATPGSDGRFDVPLAWNDRGVIIGDLTIRPPAPIPVEVLRDLEIEAFDGGVRLLGPFGYGAAIIPRPVLVYRATGRPIRRGTHSRWIHVGGLPITPAPWGIVPDDGVRIGDSTGTVAYDAATDDTGTVLFDIEVRLNDPHSWETLRSVAIPARFSDIAVRDTFRVGLWFPWIGTLRDASSDRPVGGATVTFTRTGGANVEPQTLSVISREDGIFLLRPVPLEPGFVDARIEVRTNDAYRDTSFTVRLPSTQDDTVRSIGTVKLTRTAP